MTLPAAWHEWSTCLAAGQVSMRSAEHSRHTRLSLGVGGGVGPHMRAVGHTRAPSYRTTQLMSRKAMSDHYLILAQGISLRPCNY